MTTEHGLITIVHTSFVAVDGLTALFGELAPQITLRHIVDDSLLDEVLRSGGVTPGVRKRLTTKELALLVYLSDRAGQVVRREELLEAVWGYHPDVRSRATRAQHR